MKNQSFKLTIFGYAVIYTQKRPINYHCNAGPKKVEYTTNPENYGIIYFNNSDIDTIMFMDRATKKFCVMFGSEIRNFFLLNLHNPEVISQLITNRLNFLDTSNSGVIIKNH